MAEDPTIRPVTEADVETLFGSKRCSSRSGARRSARLEEWRLPRLERDGMRRPVAR